MNRRSASCLATAALAAACSSPPPAPAALAMPRTTSLEGVGFVIAEHAHDGVWPLRHQGESCPVDANARLVVSFQTQAPPAAAAAGPEWQALQAGLEQVRALIATGTRLDTQVVDAADAAAGEAHRLQLRAHYEQLGRFARTFRDAITGHRQDLDVDAILEGRFDGHDDGTVLGNAARWLQSELDRLRRAAVERTQGRERVRVVVQAIHEPASGESMPLHVANYDRLPEGDLRPVERMGLKMSGPERARLDAEIAASQRAAEAIREITANGKAWLDGLRAQLDTLRRQARTLARQLADATTLSAQLQAARGPLRKLADESTEAPVKAAADALEQTLTELATTVTELAANTAARDLLRPFAEGGTASDPRAVLSAVGGLGQAIEALEGSVADLVEQGGRAGEQARTLAGLVGDAWTGLLPATVREWLATCPGQLPATFALVRDAKDLLARGAATTTVADRLAAARDVAIPRPLDDLPPATIDLRRAGVTLDDHVSVHVRFEDTTPGAASEPLHEVSVDTEMVLTGLHRRIGGELIFARADHGPASAQKWQANVAAVASWHYRIREPEHEASTLWNFLDPGFGLHIASLDQNDETAELGLGVNLSLFSGFVTAGFGYNLASEDDDGHYYFVGIDLLDVLRNLGTAAPSK